jgi:hypothetical protein
MVSALLILSIFRIWTIDASAALVDSKQPINFETLVQQSIQESERCLKFEKDLKSRLDGTKKGSPLKNKTHALQVLDTLKDYPETGLSTQRIWNSITQERPKPPNPTWLGAQILKIPACPVMLASEASRAILLTASQTSFSTEEWQKVSSTFQYLARRFIYAPGPLMNSMMASHILSKLSEYPAARIDPSYIRINKDFNDNLEGLRKKLSNLYLGIRASEPNLFAAYIIQETRETDKIRSKFYPLLFNK